MTGVPLDEARGTRSARHAGEPAAGRALLAQGLAIFAALLLPIGALYLVSVLVCAGPGGLLDPHSPARLHPELRFNTTLLLVLAYTAAAAHVGRHWVAQDFRALEGVVEAESSRRERWRSEAEQLGSARLARGALLGVLFGAGVNLLGTALGRTPSADSLRIHVAWAWILNPLLFATMGILVVRSSRSAALFLEMGRRARVSLLDPTPLAPFARSGLRLAVLWLLGSSLATLLLVSSDAPLVVAGVLVGTVGLAVGSLLLPSRGVHERLRAAKRAELAWVRGEIARARGALGAAPASPASHDEAMRLPALLAWEARVAEASEWPVDASTLLRFALLLLVPLGSWVGGALVERLVDAALR